LINDEDAQKIRFAHQDLFDLWPSFYVAEKMGKGLGRGEILLRPLPSKEVILLIKSLS
jgi:hypothetical protein